MKFYTASYRSDCTPEGAPDPIFRSKSAAMRHLNNWAKKNEAWNSAELYLVEFRGTRKQQVLDAWANNPTTTELITIVYGKKKESNLCKVCETFHSPEDNCVGEYE